MTFVVHDDNADDFLRQNRFPVGCLPRTTRIGELACAKVYAEHVPLIPEEEWPARIEEMTRKKLWIGDRWQSDAKADFQSKYGFCWAYSCAQAIMAVRARQGQPFIQLSPESLAEDVGYANRGNSLDSALTYVSEHGMASRKTVPQYDIYKQKWLPEYDAERKQYMPLEWYDLGGKDVWRETVTALLNGDGPWIGLVWWGHAVWYDRLRIGSSGRVEVHTPNSHGPGNDVWLTGSKAVPSMASFVLRSVTLAS